MSDPLRVWLEQILSALPQDAPWLPELRRALLAFTTEVAIEYADGARHWERITEIQKRFGVAEST